MPGSLLPSTASRQKYVAYGTDYGDECQHVLWQDMQWFKSVFILSSVLLKISSRPENIGTKRCMTKEAVIFLFIAIVVEVIATISLKLSDSFTRLVPSLVTIIGYCIAFWCLTIPMRTIPAGIIYAIWSGVGIVLIGLIGWLFLGQNWMCRLLLACCLSSAA